MQTLKNIEMIEHPETKIPPLGCSNQSLSNEYFVNDSLGLVR